MRFPVAPDKYNNLEEQLGTQEGVTVRLDNPDSGQIETGDVILGFAYANGILDISILKKKSLKARIAGDTVVFSKVSTLLSRAGVIA